jgi:ATP-dependent helicase YprA (DUF1998 family)
LIDADPHLASVPSPFTTAQSLRERIVGAVVSQAGFNHAGLNALLRARLGTSDAERGALVVEPVIEGAAAYELAAERLSDLSGKLLTRETLDALARGADHEDYRFDPSTLPYRHQLEAWQHLVAPDPRSVLVTSGTGSGKTECFLVPLLDDLARETAAGQRLSGVRAIMLYPLNALIASQRERLRRWTAPFDGRIRFGLYNGMTPEDLRGHDRRAEALRHPEEIIDRKTLRRDPPPILVTNVTMLEYLTIRREDRPLVENSKGKLRWIIIDESHSYVGSAAAEIALLLRRVLQTFSVRPTDVRFVATSATIGGADEESRLVLKRFLADLAGVDESQVHVIEGVRAPINLPTPATSHKIVDLGNRAELARNPRVQAFVRAAEAAPVPLAAACRLLGPTGVDPVALIEAIADDRDRDPLLPLRVHHFMRAVPGLWSCLNPACTGEKPADWPFGGLAFERAERCGHCHAPLFELSTCRDCGEPYIEAFDQGAMLTPVASAPDVDEFAAASERQSEASEGAEEEDEGTTAAASARGPGRRRLIATRSIGGMTSIAIDLATGALPDRRDAGTQIAITDLLWNNSCPACHAVQRDEEAGPMRAFRFGAPFLIGNAAPVMLDGVAPMDQRKRLLPADGRQLLSFTDSRQGTARFAASVETNAERAYVRGYIYHLVQKSGMIDPERAASFEKLRRDVETIEAAAKTNSSLESIARDQRAELERKVSGAATGVPWNEVHLRLSQDPIIQHWIRAVWQDRDPRFESDSRGFANFMLLREVARRPRRANALETLGLAQLRFDRIDKLEPSALPEPLQRLGRTVEEWRDFLYLMIDTPVRSYFALDVVADDVRWLLPRGGVRRNIVGPGEDKRSKSDLVWPQARPGSAKSNAVLWLEHFLGLDHESSEDRARVNEILDAAWQTLRPLFDSVGSEYALDLAKAVIAPVADCWACPVTRRVLSHRLFGRSPFGHREGSPFADQEPAALHFPRLPLSFPRSRADQAELTDWLRADPFVADLRAKGMWNNLHDRAALLAPYLRAEEHSAQQPPERLRAFEGEFRRGEINMLACSTTMEMGIDIGAVSAVLMTNVPPSIANYRQRVGRAGRRRQGFASSLTLARDTPLDRETFRQPEAYLARQLRPPQVTLDAPRIVQRHVNALLLSRWFAEAEGELLKIKTGAFFGFPESPDLATPDHSPVGDFCRWLADPSVRARMGEPLGALVRVTALDGDSLLCTTASDTFEAARRDFERQWDAVRSEVQAAPSDQARNSLVLQLKRLCRESLLKELANRALLPGHGFPTAVVPFINDSRETRTRTNRDGGEGGETASMRRYDYPSRNADIAIREYAPGAEVVIDGLVWRSAGVTLNWQRPAHEEAAREIQSLRHFWQCHECGAADCSQLRVERCPACDAQVTDRRFLEPAGFRVDWNAPSHADTDQITFIEPEPARISARGADWEPLLDPALGRGRASTDGLVFFAAAGARHRGYRICLECGRAEEERDDGLNPLAEHTPLRGTRLGADRICPGGARAFAVTEPVALGHEVLTDVAELQPAHLADLGGAWALVSALREAHTQRLGIQSSEIGMGVEPRRGTLAQPTHSLFLFDRNAGGAGFATRLFDDLPALLDATCTILSCDVPGCEHGCAACILTADLFAQQEIVDRKEALACVKQLLDGIRAPQAEDAALPQARLSPPAADAIVRRMARGDSMTLFASEAFDLAVLSEEPFAGIFAAARVRGVEARLGLKRTVVSGLNAAQRLGLRDAAMRCGFTLSFADPPAAPNGAALIAMLDSSAATTAWFTRDSLAGSIAGGWGIGQVTPVVYGTMNAGLVIAPIDPALLLPKATTAVRVIAADKGRPLRLFGDWFAKLVREELEPLGLWHAGALLEIRYSDRYLRSPLCVAVTLRALAGLRDALVGKGTRIRLMLVSSPLDIRKSQAPFLLFHDWQRGDDREAVIARLSQTFTFDPVVDLRGAEHARELQIGYRDGQVAHLYLDQGFGYWQTAGRDRFDFAATPGRQAKQLEEAAPMVAGNGSTYIAIAKAG